MLKASYENIWIGAIVQKELSGLLDGTDGIDQIITFNRTPGEKKRILRGMYPDYLLDLSGESRFWLFRSQLRVVDFKFSARQINTIRNTQNFSSGLMEYNRIILDLLSVFGLDDSATEQIDTAYWEDKLFKYNKE